MKNESFSSKFEELKPKVPVHADVERKLLPRLKFMGYIMCFWCAAALVLAFLAPKNAAADIEHPEASTFSFGGVALENNEEESLEFEAFEVLNFYFVSLTFAAVAASCFAIAWKKKKKLFHETPASGE